MVSLLRRRKDCEEAYPNSRGLVLDTILFESRFESRAQVSLLR